MEKKLWLLSCDIIDHAFKDKEERILKRYKHIYFEISKKELDSKHGDYTRSLNRIRIFNLSRDNESSLCTSLHELAHHVDYVNRGDTDHSKEFYNVYKELIKAAIEMGLVTKEQILSLKRDASDSNKVKKIVEEINITKIENYKVDKKIIQVKNCFNIKEWLKQLKYTWNGTSQLWEKEVEKEEEEEELNKIYTLTDKENITIIKANKISFDCFSYLLIMDSYDFKEQLKIRGYHYDKGNKGWKKKFNNKELNKEVLFMKELGLNKTKILR